MSGTPSRPTPKFFMERQPLSTKKDRGTPAKKPPPRPPIKSVSSVSRIFMQKTKMNNKAQAVSFRGDSSFASRHYNDSISVSYLNQCFDNVSRLGSGSFGEVFKVRSKEDGKYYAVKVFKEKFRGESDRQQKLSEVQKQELFQPHPNCVGFIKAWEEKRQLYIQTELCDTSLYEYAEENHEIPEEFVYNCLADLLLAVAHLHNLNLVHLDIKPENVFMVDGIFKLGDFGLVMELAKVSDAQEGDPKYLAAELMQGIFTKAADIFSLGIMMLELACDLDLPAGDEYWHNLREGLLPVEFTRRVSPGLLRLIRWMMAPGYRDRPTAQTLLAEPEIRTVVVKRRKEKWARQTRAFFARLWIRLLAMWHFVIEPVLKPFSRSKEPVKSNPGSPEPTARKSRQCTPSLDNSYNTIDFDYSDEEVFDESGFQPIPFDISTSSNEADQSTSCNVFNSTPTRARPSGRTPAFETPRAGSPFRTDLKTTPLQGIFNCSRIVANEDDSTLPNNVSPLRLPRFSPFDPKNLMDAFENASSDDEL